ncbi:unnamed protein product, partial [Musa hybrid cultivar]
DRIATASLRTPFIPLHRRRQRRHQENGGNRLLPPHSPPPPLCRPRRIGTVLRWGRSRNPSIPSDPRTSTPGEVGSGGCTESRPAVLVVVGVLDGVLLRSDRGATLRSAWFPSDPDFLSR